MRNSNIAIGVEVLESGLKQLPDLEVQQLELVPPRRIGVNMKVSVTILGRAVILYPDAKVQLSVADGRIRLEIVEVNLFGVSVPPALIQAQLRDLVQVPEQEANNIIQEASNRTGMKLSAVSVSEDNVILTFDH